ncbi:MAG: dockerin type I domain-containing protein [Clostridiales bacterium]|nr:dockerin type I domain-containing protein [Clostridiales bacterium]
MRHRDAFSASLVFSLLLFGALPATVYAVPANPWPHTYIQPDGTEISVYLKGDEFLNWAEDEDGSHIIFDETKNAYCYARWTATGSISTGCAASMETENTYEGKEKLFEEKPFIEQGGAIPQVIMESAWEAKENLRPDTAADDAVLSESLQRQAEDESDGSFESAPSLVGVSSLQRKMLVIYVRWEDETEIRPSPLTGPQIYDMIFNPSTHSVNNYYQEMFGARQDIVLPATVTNGLDGKQGVIQVTLPGRHPNSGATLGAVWMNMMRTALTEAEPYIDFASFDLNRNGYLSRSELSVCVIVHGYEASANPFLSPSIWAAAWSSASSGYILKLDGVAIQGLFAQGAFHGVTDDSALTIGVICHEFGHSGYNFIDMYDRTQNADGEKSAGLGYWSLMASGSWTYRGSHEKDGASPSYVDAYNLTKYGLVTPGVISSGAGAGITLKSPTEIYKIVTSDAKQYFLLQQRQYGAVDNFDRGAFYTISNSSGLDTGGLLIYHVDENVTTQNDKDSHYMVSIEEAHGGRQHLRALNSTGRNLGDLGDLWGSAVRYFASDSDPSSRLYSAFSNDDISPTQTKDSGVIISGVTWNPISFTTTLNAGFNGNVLYGDVDGDNRVTLRDAVLIAQLVAGGYNITLNDTQKLAADVNRDGKINLRDAVLITQHIAGGYGVTLGAS